MWTVRKHKPQCLIGSNAAVADNEISSSDNYVPDKNTADPTSKHLLPLA